MAFYHKLGVLPEKKHITFYKEDGKSLYREELVSSIGFSSIYSNKYHIHAPTQLLNVTELSTEPEKIWSEAKLVQYHFNTDAKSKGGDFFSSRILFLTNPHCKIYTAKPNRNPDYFYKNAYNHEYIFVHHGSGKFISDYGCFNFEPGDQIVIYKGILFQMLFDDFENNKLLVVESDSPYEIPKHFRNEYGQLTEDAPLCERDIKLPEQLEIHDEIGEFKLHVKYGNRMHEFTLPNHPLDVVGWDGYLYPYAFNIKDYAPKVGKLHLPPPVHLLFSTQHFVLCNFCPRLFDFHPKSIPAPYFHTNIDSAEVLYYVEGDFMSRSGVKEGSITLHPIGVPHGPQPGKTEQSIGVDKTEEYAVMIDTFELLYITENVKETMVPDYYKSWLEK